MLCNIQYTLGINQIPVSTKWQCCQGWWSLFFEAELPGVVLKPFHSRQVLVWHSQKTEITWPSWSPISWWILKKDSQCCSLPTHCLPLIHVLLTGEGYPVWLLLLTQHMSFDSFYQKVCFSLVLTLLAVCGRAHWVSNRNREPTSSYPVFSFQLKHGVATLSKHHSLSLLPWSIN